MGAPKPPKGSLRREVLDVLHHRTVQHTLLFLLIIDVVTVIFSSLVEVYYFESKFEDSQKVLEACIDGTRRRLGGSDGDSVSCALPDHYGDHTFHDIELGLIMVSCVILAIFVAEHILHIWVLRWEYLKSWHHPLDLFIVVVSLGLEIMAFRQVTDVSNAAGLVVPLGRVWRFARIIHATTDVVEEIEEEVAEQNQPDSTEYGAPTTEKTADVEGRGLASVEM